jgi:hypothetical protein
MKVCVSAADFAELINIKELNKIRFNVLSGTVPARVYDLYTSNMIKQFVPLALGLAKLKLP